MEMSLNIVLYKMMNHKRLILFMFILIFIFLINITTLRLQSTENFLEFIHIPKNAGTTIENIANDKDIKWGRFKPEHRNKVNTDTCSYWHVPPEKFNPGSFYDNDETFCIFRDPRDKMVSEYSYRHRGQQNKNNKYEMNKWLKENLNHENVVNGGLNCHFIPQHKYIYNDNSQKTCNHILNFDNLTPEFNKLMKDKGIELELNSSKKDNTSNFNLTRNDINDDNLELIYKLYEKDFDIQRSI